MSLSQQVNGVEPSVVLQPVMSLGGLTFPSDIAEVGEGRFAVLDRLERTVSIHSADGTTEATFGREGKGPGEFEAPYALAAAGGNLAVLDLNSRLTVLGYDGEVTRVVSDVGGDARAVWQRMPISRWEEPLQLSREDVTRRLGSLGPGRFGLLLQDRDERFDQTFVQEQSPTRFSYHLLSFGFNQGVDTVLTLPGQELQLVAPPEENHFAIPRERTFPLRPMWSSGKGWTAVGHGSWPRVEVHLDGADVLSVEWPEDRTPLGDDDYHAFMDWEIEASRRTKGEAAANAIAAADRAEVIARHLGHWTDRPQLGGLLGAGPCLGILGFSPTDGPLAESSTLVVINLRDPRRLVAIKLDSPLPGFVRHLSRTSVFRIAVAEDGTRLVERFSLPGELCSTEGAAQDRAPGE